MSGCYGSLRRHYPDQVLRVEDVSPPLSPVYPGLPVWMSGYQDYSQVVDGSQSVRSQAIFLTDHQVYTAGFWLAQGSAEPALSGRSGGPIFGIPVQVKGAAAWQEYPRNVCDCQMKFAGRGLSLILQLANKCAPEGSGAVLGQQNVIQSRLVLYFHPIRPSVNASSGGNYGKSASFDR